MSSPQLELALSADARRDLRQILSYTSKRWGLAQAETYRRSLFSGLDLICANPNLGRIREDIDPGVRSILIEEHIAYYVIEENQIIVLRLLHPSRRFPRTSRNA